MDGDTESIGDLVSEAPELPPTSRLPGRPLEAQTCIWASPFRTSGAAYAEMALPEEWPMKHLFTTDKEPTKKNRIIGARFV